jgi:DNA-binding CsgD family transcriptional regulator
MSPSPNKPRARNGDPLTPREAQILALVATGEPTAAIGQRLGISENTVKGHLTHVYTKTGSRNRVQATRHYLDHYTTPASPPRSSQPASRGRKKPQP